MKKLFALTGLFFLSAIFASADIFYITARPSPSGTGANSDGTYSEIGLSGAMGDTSVKSSAVGFKASSGSRYYLLTNSLIDPAKGVDIFPTLTNLTGTYQIDYTQNPSAGNVTEDAVFSVSATGGTLNFNNTTLFQRSGGTNVWSTMGRITLNGTTNTPKISFRYQSGEINDATLHRWILDCWRFTLVEPCLSVAVPGITGPIAAGATNPVVVTGISASATAINVYQDSGSGMTKIATRVSGIVAGDNIVTATNLVKGAQVSATQIVGGQESCVQFSGVLVGGGANPRIRLALSTRSDPNLTGPIGANGSNTTSSCIWHLGATNLAGTAPGNSKVVLQPSTNWQTVTWWRDNPTAPDAAVNWNGSDCFSLAGDFGILEGLSIAMDDLTDTGPMTLYIDNVENGGTMIQDFESVTNGQNEVSFRRPRFSGTTSGNLLSAPNDSYVTNQISFAGSNSLRVSFQFNSLGSNKWVRLTTSGAPSKPNPEIDLRLPITMRILLLPSSSQPGAPNISYSLSGNNLTLNWAGSFNLQSRTNLTSGTWNNVGVSAGPFMTAVTNAAKFFRLQSP